MRARRAGGLQGVERGLDLAERGHAGGEDHGPAEGTDVAQIRQVGDLAGGNLEALGAERGEVVEAGDIEAGGEEADTLRLTVGDQGRVHRRAQLQLAQHRDLRLGLIGGARLVFGLGGARGREPLGAEGLELDQVGAGLGGDLDQALGESEVSMMVDAGFGDDESGFSHAGLSGLCRRARPLARRSLRRSRCLP